LDVQNHLVEGEFYHLYGRALAKNGKLFYQARNYDSFLKNFSKYLGDYLDIWSYCLMPDHFHFLVRVKLKVDTTITDRWHEFANYFSELINKQENRCGNLFQKGPQFLRIENKSHLLTMVKYINYNPVFHGLVDNPSDWRHSSHTKSINDRLKHVEINKLMTIFDQTTAFSNFQYHQQEFESIQYCLAE